MIRVVLRVQKADLSIVHTQAFHGSYLNGKTHTWLDFVGFVPKVYSFNNMDHAHKKDKEGEHIHIVILFASIRIAGGYVEVR